MAQRCGEQVANEAFGEKRGSCCNCTQELLGRRAGESEDEAEVACCSELRRPSDDNGQRVKGIK